MINTRGLIISEVKYGEGHKMLTALTPEYGKIQIGANGIRSFKSKNSAGCSLFGYSEFILKENREIYSLSSAENINNFYSIRNDVEKIALAAYFCELLNCVTRYGMPAHDILKLALNTMYFLSESGTFIHVKPVFELRLMSETGFAPNALSCVSCQSEEKLIFFSSKEGGMLCENCGSTGSKEHISNSALTAIRYILTADHKKIFSFTASGEVLTELTKISEQYIISHLEHTPKSLRFLKSL